jgi:hypothetical protein
LGTVPLYFVKLAIFTIVLDGLPFIGWQLPIFQKLNCDWRWIVVEGAAQNNGSTRWCKPQEARLSNDGTTEYLNDLREMKNITVIQAPDWESKDAMVNAALSDITEPCVLMEIDVDELYESSVIDKIVELFENDAGLGAIKMFCRYFVGPNLICEGKNCWSNNTYEWLRVWRFEPGTQFTAHEPPILTFKGRMMEREEAAGHGLTFDHLAYARREQVEFKEKFYGYTGAANQWDALQRNTVWPAKLSRFFPFVSGDLPLVRKI